eukprot:14733868-Alexandrium_andersonii.AAC.1
MRQRRRCASAGGSEKGFLKRAGWFASGSGLSRALHPSTCASTWQSWRPERPSSPCAGPFGGQAAGTSGTFALATAWPRPRPFRKAVRPPA